MDSPGKYTGTDDHNTFIQFLEKMCNWLRSQLIAGLEVDYYRVTLLAEQLEGHAADWLSNLRKNHMEATGEEPRLLTLCATCTVDSSLLRMHKGPHWILRASAMIRLEGRTG